MRVVRFVSSVLCGMLAFSITSSVILGQVSDRERKRVNRNFHTSKSEFRSKKSSRSESSKGSHEDNLRTYDGSGNNQKNPFWGKAGANLARRTPADYLDGVYVPSRATSPNRRRLSNLFSRQAESTLNDRFLTDMVWQWGQFLDHDLSLTESVNPPEYWPVPIPRGDESFDPNSEGAKVIHFFRSEYNHNTGKGTNKPRQQVNAITSWIDGSNIYGSNEETAKSLRLMRRGLMKTSAGALLPLGENGFFMAGDIRANEQVGLTSMHTLFVREHNRIARAMGKRFPNRSDERIFQEARREVIAELQAITYNEFLPALLGPHGPAPYKGYRSNVKPDIMNVFSTAAYRFGHSMLSTEILRLDNQSNELEGGPLSLQNAFFNPNWVLADGIEPYLKGLTVQQAQEIDAKLVDDVRNFLFGAPGAGGFDLATLNIQRGRDHGLTDYNRIRVAFGLQRVKWFDEITSDIPSQLAMFRAYEDVSNIDPWLAMLVEDHLPGASMGPTSTAVLKEQFRKLRDGDRFWYERTFEGRKLLELRETRLSAVIERNSKVRYLQKNVFFTQDHQPQR